jgi:hypothetical protein
VFIRDFSKENAGQKQAERADRKEKPTLPRVPLQRKKSQVGVHAAERDIQEDVDEAGRKTAYSKPSKVFGSGCCAQSSGVSGRLPECRLFVLAFVGEKQSKSC